MHRDKRKDKLLFEEIFFKFIYKDIENCIKAKANYVVALALLSYTEFIGGLISGNLGLKNKSRDNFNEALLRYFPKEYSDLNSSLKIEYIEYKDKNGKKRTEEGIYALFRCGMVHEYFIKEVTSTVINNPDGQTNEHIIGIRVIPMEVLSGGSEKLLVFHTNEYFRDFKEAVKKIYKGLIIDCDPKLLEGFNKSLDRIYSRRIL